MADNNAAQRQHYLQAPREGRVPVNSRIRQGQNSGERYQVCGNRTEVVACHVIYLTPVGAFAYGYL
jgi:hypothetical protein